jgi:hypothetical protein
VELVRRESELRKDPKTLAEMENAEASVANEWMDVVERLQHQIIEEYRNSEGQSRIGSVTVTDLRAAALRHPDIAFWVKYNRARRGSLKVGDRAPDVPLRRATDGQETTLLASDSSMHDSPERTVVIAGSYS